MSLNTLLYQCQSCPTRQTKGRSLIWLPGKALFVMDHVMAIWQEQVAMIRAGGNTVGRSRFRGQRQRTLAVHRREDIHGMAPQSTGIIDPSPTGSHALQLVVDLYAETPSRLLNLGSHIRLPLSSLCADLDHLGRNVDHPLLNSILTFITILPFMSSFKGVPSSKTFCLRSSTTSNLIFFGKEESLADERRFHYKHDETFLQTCFTVLLSGG